MARLIGGISVRDQIVPVAPGRSFTQAVRDIGADSIECAISVDSSVPTLGGSLANAESIDHLRRVIKSGGPRISALLLATDFSGPSANDHVTWAVRTVKAAAALDVPVVRIDPWTAAQGMAVEIIVANFIRAAQGILDQTADTHVDLGMENHGLLFNDPDILDQVLSELPDDRFGLTLDTGNLYWWGQPVNEVYRLIERYVPRAKHTHIKNINYPPELANTRRETGFEYKRYCCPLAEGNLDLGRIVKLLHEAGYRRDLCVEDESLFKVAPQARMEVLRQDVAALRQACEL